MMPFLRHLAGGPCGMRNLDDTVTWQVGVGTSITTWLWRSWPLVLLLQASFTALPQLTIFLIVVILERTPPCNASPQQQHKEQRHLLSSPFTRSLACFRIHLLNLFAFSSPLSDSPSPQIILRLLTRRPLYSSARPLLLAPRTCPAMDEYEKSGITTHKDVKRFALSLDPSTVTVMDSENIGGGVETGSTGERDMHSDATSEKHSTPPTYSDVPKQEHSISSSSSSSSKRESALRLSSDVGEVHGHGGFYGTESTPSSQLESTGHASDFQSAEGLASDMPDRKGIHKPASSGDRATDITGIPYIQ